MDVSDDEMAKLLDPKDTVINDENVNSQNIQRCVEEPEENVANGEQKANGHCNPDCPPASLPPCTERRSDEPTELSFERGNAFIIFFSKVSRQTINNRLVNNWNGLEFSCNSSLIECFILRLMHFVLLFAIVNETVNNKLICFVPCLLAVFSARECRRENQEAENRSSAFECGYVDIHVARVCEV